MTMGSESLVSHPSTGIWKANTMAIEIQYWAVVKMPVRSHSSSSAPTATMLTTVITVYSGIDVPPARVPPQRQAPGPGDDLADRLVGEQAADRDDHEEHQLLQRHRERQP